MSWRPTATNDALIKRARLLAQVRDFFALRRVLEVDLPVLGACTVSDPHLDSVSTEAPRSYLQSSPEYFMKRLLAAGSGAIYALAKAFRAGDRGRYHNPEFTLLEWYRPGWDENQLMEEVADLLRSVACVPDSAAQRVTYRDIFLATVSLDPHRASLGELAALASDIAQRDMSTESRATCLDLIFSFEIEARLPPGIVFVHDYPECLCALAQLGVDADGVTVARRFEVFLERRELANGYFELLNAGEQRRRFSEDNRQRKAMGKPEILADEQLLAALDAGLPSCAGVALGIDRLLMHLVGAEHIREVIAFAD
ncbi:MAG: EF-P lysine aminoacylase GenX [Gammaproteobacteria bacterium]|nr:EF-P lysine aminoacylase GenX [Gammaproteobacteria bacterium]MBQ0840308.1 EF-P lysine aminoacylase GenX [Gammaproteobacteria bacterium]